MPTTPQSNSSSPLIQHDSPSFKKTLIQHESPTCKKNKRIPFKDKTSLYNNSPQQQQYSNDQITIQELHKKLKYLQSLLQKEISQYQQLSNAHKSLQLSYENQKKEIENLKKQLEDKQSLKSQLNKQLIYIRSLELDKKDLEEVVNQFKKDIQNYNQMDIQLKQIHKQVSNLHFRLMETVVAKMYKSFKTMNYSQITNKSNETIQKILDDANKLAKEEELIIPSCKSIWKLLIEMIQANATLRQTINILQKEIVDRVQRKSLESIKNYQKKENNGTNWRWWKRLFK